MPRFVPVMGKQLLKDIQADIAKTLIPEWFKSAPQHVGDVKQGKLSSKEWRSTFTCAFTITLGRVWGRTYRKSPTTGQHEAFDNFLHLVFAIILSTQAEMSKNVIELFKLHMTTYLEGFKILYPTHSITPYQHIALHFGDFLELLGPWQNWGMGAFEMFINMAKKIPTNSKFGTLGSLLGERRRRLTPLLRRSRGHSDEQVLWGIAHQRSHLQRHLTTRDRAHGAYDGFISRLDGIGRPGTE